MTDGECLKSLLNKFVVLLYLHVDVNKVGIYI